MTESDFDSFDSDHAGIKFCMNENSDECYMGQTVEDPAGFECPSGHYCPEGSYYATPCPIGTYRTGTGGVSVDDCDACDVGTYCPNSAMTAPGDWCEAGYYCEVGEGDIFANPCEPGHRCIAGYN